MRKTKIEFTHGELDDLYLALDTALQYFRVYDQEKIFEKHSQVLESFKKVIIEESNRLDETI